jgi:cell division protein FtsI/penicillin-binding protein 2
MAKRLQYRRLLVLVLLLGAAFAGLGYRLVDLQVLRHEELLEKAQNNTQHEFLREPRRGDILDANGNLLATSVFVKTVCCNPSLIGNQQAIIAKTVAPILQLNEAELIQRLTPRVTQATNGVLVTNRYVVLKRNVPLETWAQADVALKQLRFVPDEKKLSRDQRRFYTDLRNGGVFADAMDEQMRVYPNDNLAAHVLGYVASRDVKVENKALRELHGMDGIELAFNSRITGVRGWRVTEKEKGGSEVVAMREQDVEPRDGLNVVLTIDSVLQHIMESALAEAFEKHAPISITGIIERPRTGEILAMATLPNFNPNNPGNDEAARRNRVIADLVEPGSTFKIVVVSGALNEHIVTPRDMFYCEEGHFAYAGRVLHDHEALGLESVQNIIMKSSNIGAAKVGIKMGQDRLSDYIHSYGFGTNTGIQLCGEARGIVHPVSKWSKVSIAQIPMGHGIAVTRLQMLMAMSAIANKGVLMRPTIVDRFVDRDGTVVARSTPQQVRRVITEDTAKQMVTALKTVVSEQGTAPKAALTNYTVAGKTGTAQKVENGTYVSGKYISSFIGFFPADNPELCISVVMDEPKNGYYGGQTAAPVFKRIAESAANYLNIQPDKIIPQPDEKNSTAATDPGPVRTVAARELVNH